MTKRRIIAVGALLALVAGAAFAANPNWPNGPDDDPRDAPPDDLNGAWELISYTPDDVLDTIRPEELGLPSGISADRAWQVTIGRPDVVIAVMDSGIYWDDSELIDKLLLNIGELPLPEGAEVYDTNGDGAVNVKDYEGDSRIFDANGNNRTDPGDFIRIFSDGVDDDGNGYVDDICGWDFFWNDNDAEDETRAGHGRGEMRWSAGKANNGGGGLGTCPRCMLLPLRVSDDFAGNVVHVDEAAVYAVDNGASVLQHANGTVNATAATRAAVDYAYESGVAWIGAMNDENSMHNNYPSALPRIVNVKAVVHDTRSRSDATSFLRHNNCSGYGPRTTVSASHGSCSSGATGITSGVAGLLYSRARDIDLDPPITANEIKQLLTMTADDIDIPESLTNGELMPSQPGWEWSFGYGRVNARSAVDRIGEQTMPPEAEIVSPTWFDYLDLLTSPTVEITGFADAARANSFAWELQVAPGAEPLDDEFSALCSDNGLTLPVDGALCTVNAAALGVDAEADPTDKNRYSFTLRLVVTDNLGNRGEDRKIAYLRRDPDTLPSFPKFLGSSLESSVLLTDLDGDGAHEIVAAGSDGTVHAFRGDGSEAVGWPVRTPRREYLDANSPTHHLAAPAYAEGALSGDFRHSVMGAPASGYLDHNDDLPSVVVTTMDGAVCAWDGAGVPRAGFPVYFDPQYVNARGVRERLEYGAFSAPVLADLDGDEELEIIVAAMDRYLYVWREDGRMMPGFPVRVNDPQGTAPARIVSTPAVGDLDGDGTLEIVVGTNERDGNLGRTYAIHHDGNLNPEGPFVAGWPVRFQSPAIILLPYVGEGTPTSPVLADLDGDGTLEVATNSGVSMPMLYGHDGTLKNIFLTLPFGPGSDSVDFLGAVAMNFLAFANLDGHPRPELLSSGASLGFGLALADGGVRYPFDAVVYAFNTGALKFILPDFPRAGEDWFFLNAPSVVDLTGDGDAEIIIGSGGYMIHAWDRRGDEPPGWPKFTGGWNVASPSVGDVDGDGDLDVVVGTREGWLYAWGTPASAATQIESKGFHHDERNTGNYHTPIATQDGPATTTTVTTTTTTTSTFPADDDPPLEDDDGMDDDATDDDAEPTPGPTFMTDDEVFERTACCGG